MTTDIKQVARHELARRDFLVFVSYVRIQDTDPWSGTAEMPFVLWPHLEELANDLLNDRLIIVLKARQIGVTWLLAAYMYWLAAYHPGVRVIVISKGDNEAKEVISRMAFIHQRLPEGLRAETQAENTSVWEFTNESEILAFPATTQAGSSYTASVVFHDEADKHPYLDASISAAKPTIDGGGQHVIVSSANAENGPDSPFKKRYLEAKSGHSGYKARFYPWNVRPDRTEEWFNEATAGYDIDSRQKEYPATEQEALSPPQSLAGIRHDVLDLMTANCREPLPYTNGQPPDSRIFAHFWPGKKYVAFSDVASGTGHDYYATVILDADDETVVADIFNNSMELDDFVFQSANLLHMYDDPLWGIETNGEWGGRAIEMALQLRYRNLYHRPVSTKDDSPGRAGWLTDRRTRPNMLGELRSSCLSGHLTVYAKDGLGQFYDLAKDPKNDGRIEAVEGRHDDYPMAVAGALMMKQSPAARRSKRTMLNERTGEYERRPVRIRRMSAETIWRW